MDIWSSIQRSQHATIQCHAVRVGGNIWQPLQCGEDCELCEAHRFRSRRGKASCQLRNSQLLVPFVASEVKVETGNSPKWTEFMPIPEDVHLSYLAILSSKTFQADNVHECSVKIHTDIQHITVYPSVFPFLPSLASHCGWAMPTPSAWCSPLPVRRLSVWVCNVASSTDF